MTPRLDAIEIKVSIGRSATDRAMEGLGLREDDGETRRIYFCEGRADDAAGPAASLALLSQGVVLRLRDKRTAGKADSTVKFRPFDAARLAERWRPVTKVDDGELRVEGDWTGSTQVVAASLVVDQRPDEVTDAASGKRPLARLFSREQEEFLRDHASPSVDLATLRVLGPIMAVKWEPAARGFPKDLAVEHWRVDELEFLELSVRTEEPDEAPLLQSELEQFLRARGLFDDVVFETKTRTVLEYLSGRQS